MANTVDSIPCLTAEKNVRLFEKYGVFTKNELQYLPHGGNCAKVPNTRFLGPKSLSGQKHSIIFRPWALET